MVTRAQVSPNTVAKVEAGGEVRDDTAARIIAAFSLSGLSLLNVIREDFAHKCRRYMMGRSPVLFDFPTSLPGLDFALSWEPAVHRKVAGVWAMTSTGTASIEEINGAIGIIDSPGRRDQDTVQHDRSSRAAGISPSQLLQNCYPIRAYPMKNKIIPALLPTLLLGLTLQSGVRAREVFRGLRGI